MCILYYQTIEQRVVSVGGKGLNDRGVILSSVGDRTEKEAANDLEPLVGIRYGRKSVVVVVVVVIVVVVVVVVVVVIVVVTTLLFSFRA